MWPADRQHRTRNGALARQEAKLLRPLRISGAIGQLTEQFPNRALIAF
jgi:hypothetical protein